MKLISKLLTATALLVSAQLATAADIVITGSTAARTTTLNTLLNNTFDSTPDYIWSGNTTFTKSTLALFKGNINSVPYRVMCSWSGSGTGIKDVAQQNSITVIDPATVITVSQYEASPSTTSSTAQFAMSDVFQASTAYTSPSLVNTNAFVVEFTFITNPGGNAAGITNMNPQLMKNLYSSPFGIDLSYITGDSGDTGTKVFGTGRNDGSGTRITALAESGYGVTSVVNNWRLHDNGTAITGMMQWPTVTTGFGPKEGLSSNNTLGNGGYTSGGEVGRLLSLPSTNPSYFATSDTSWSSAITPLGQVHLISYVGVADLVAGNEQLTYSGSAYSSDNIRTGKYTLWSYEHLYDKGSLTTDEESFKSALTAGIPSNLGTGSIATSSMTVSRPGGDGASVL